MINIYLIT